MNFLIGKEFIGSKTECALLLFAHKLEQDYSEIRKKHKVLASFPFSSDKKRMSTIIDYHGNYIMHTKGASEIILELCDNFLDSNMNVQNLTSEVRNSLRKTIETMASEGLRTLTLAYKAPFCFSCLFIHIL